LAEELTTTTARSRDGKPFAPLEALLPATRSKVWIDRVHELASKLTTTDNKDLQYSILKDMDYVLTHRPKLFVKEKPLKRTPTGVSSANKDQFQKNREDLSIPDQLEAMMNQVGVERQWGLLQYSESQREQGNELRAAFNFYTKQLEFGDSYLLTASKEEKKRMIRNEQLPSLVGVIASDLDLRDLYRNQLLTAMDDVQAEVAYQVKQSPNDVDISEVVELMNQANVACSKWFDLIAPEDIQDALDVLLQE
jgi:hypothetical protein